MTNTPTSARPRRGHRKTGLKKKPPKAESRLETIRREWRGIHWRIADLVNSPTTIVSEEDGVDVTIALATTTANALAITMAPYDIDFLLKRCARLEREVKELRQRKINYVAEGDETPNNGSDS